MEKFAETSLDGWKKWGVYLDSPRQVSGQHNSPVTRGSEGEGYAEMCAVRRRWKQI
jgi:hypothetical protein